MPLARVWGDCRQQDHTDEWAAHHGDTNTHNVGPTCQRHDQWKQRGYRT